MIWRSTLLVPALGCWLACAATATTVTFDFDTGTPPIFAGQNLPFDQGSGGVTAHFSSPTVGASGFSVQSDATTQFHLSQFSGNYLYPNSVNNPALDIQFDQPVTSITFAFATADFQQVEVPTTIRLTAYENATGTPSIGVATAHGTYGGDTMPMGTLAFAWATPFNLVEITIPYAPLAASGFLVDSITVTTTSVAPTATSSPTQTPTPTAPSMRCLGDCGNDGQVNVNEIIVMVNIALGNTPCCTSCAAADPTNTGQVIVTQIIQAVNNALNGCP